MDKLPLIQRLWNNYIWTVTPIFSEKAGQILTPNEWLKQASELTYDEEKVKKSAVTIPAVLRAIQLLSETVASMPLRIYKKSADGSHVEAVNHKLYNIISHSPNNHMSSFTWRKLLVNNALMFGAGTSRIVKNGAGEVVKLTFLNYDGITIKYNKAKDTYYFEYRSDKKKREYDILLEEDEILNFPWYTTDGINGIAPLALAAEALGVSLAQQSNQFNTATNDSRSTGILVNQGAGKEQTEQAKTAWQDAQTGKNRGKTAVLSGGWDYKQLTIPNDQLQFIQQREFSVTEVARIFGVPPHLLSDLSRATYSNIEHQGIEFVTYTLMGLLKNIETELERKLLSESERKRHFIRFNVNGLLRADAKTRSELYSKGIQSGWMTPNEVRSLEELIKVDGGDRLFIPMNLQPLDKVDENRETQEPNQGANQEEEQDEASGDDGQPID